MRTYRIVFKHGGFVVTKSPMDLYAVNNLLCGSANRAFQIGMVLVVKDNVLFIEQIVEDSH